MPVLKNLLDIGDDRILTNVLWALVSLTSGDEKQTREVLEMNFAGHIVGAMKSNEEFLKAPALVAAGNLLVVCEEISAIMIENGVISALSNLLNDPIELIRKEACWALSNVLAGSVKQIDQILAYQQGSIINRLFNMIKTDVKEVSICI